MIHVPTAETAAKMIADSLICPETELDRCKVIFADNLKKAIAEQKYKFKINISEWDKRAVTPMVNWIKSLGYTVYYFVGQLEINFDPKRFEEKINR